APLSDLVSRFITSPPRNTPSTSSFPSVSHSPALRMASNSTESAVAPSNVDLDSDESDSEDEVVETLEERRAAYRRDKVAERAGRKKKQDGDDLSPEMDDLINAGSETRRIKCFRVPFRLYFSSDKPTSDHSQCRQDLPGGCPRCVANIPRVCCELCNPAYFESFAMVDLPKPPPIPHKSRIAKYESEARDMKLRNALHEFRRDATRRKFSRAVLKNSGPGVVMSNEVLQRIVDCAHWYKIQTLEHLEKETRWAGAAEFGADVLALIDMYSPRPVPPEPESTPLATHDSNGASSSVRTLRSRKCSKCGALDHIASNKKCPFHPQHRPQHIDENTEPPAVPFSTSARSETRPQPRPLYQQLEMSVFTPPPATSFTTPLAVDSPFASTSDTTTPLPSINWPDYSSVP
ncbi:P-loop containing nucleoside triphosphate hydrolase protein, partial [Favolaschia claudopus]